ncbi:hypothetical protein DFH09DRAFT_1284077 [Mycena vulgaris]|nr:hypothetical protein DFH09DRAFT_1284077 [Mycena vulgaris]
MGTCNPTTSAPLASHPLQGLALLRGLVQYRPCHISAAPSNGLASRCHSTTSSPIVRVPSAPKYKSRATRRSTRASASTNIHLLGPSCAAPSSCPPSASYSSSTRTRLVPSSCNRLRAHNRARVLATTHHTPPGPFPDRAASFPRTTRPEAAEVNPWRSRRRAKCTVCGREEEQEEDGVAEKRREYSRRGAGRDYDDTWDTAFASREWRWVWGSSGADGASTSDEGTWREAERREGREEGGGRAGGKDSQREILRCYAPACRVLLVGARRWCCLSVRVGSPAARRKQMLLAMRLWLGASPRHLRRGCRLGGIFAPEVAALPSASEM